MKQEQRSTENVLINNRKCTHKHLRKLIELLQIQEDPKQPSTCSVAGILINFLKMWKNVQSQTVINISEMFGKFMETQKNHRNCTLKML